MKNKFLKTTIATAVAAAMAVGVLAPIHATVVDTQTVTENTSAECVVTYSQDSSFTVTIPKTVDISKSGNKYTNGIGINLNKGISSIMPSDPIV